VNNNITYVAMDTHKKEHHVALHYPQQGEIVNLTVRNTPSELSKMVRKIIKKAPGEVRFCYEAGVCGFTLKRRIDALGGCCAVIAPSLTPIKPGERVKTDRRDAAKLLALFQAGLLTEVHAPDPQQEAARELTRLRHTARDHLMRSHHQLLKFLTRHGYVYTEGHHWTGKHLRWLRGLDFEEPLLQEVFDSYFTEMQHRMQRLASLDRQVAQLAERAPYQEIVGLLRCFHGIDTLTAITLLTEIFAFGRFASPRALMSYLGLTPSESSSGETQTKGAITKTGNKRVRRLLVEVAWHYRHPYHLSKTLKQRRQDQPQWVIDIADRAGHRLRKRYWHLIHRGKMPCKATTAVARELVGFIWSVVREYERNHMERAA
jgi:transposase